MRLILFYFSFCMPIMGIAQADNPYEKEEEDDYNPSPLSSVSVQSAGMIMDASFEAQIQNFKKLAPMSEILKRDLSGYSKDINFYDQGSGAFSVYVDFPLESELLAPYNPKLRIGIQFMYYNALNYRLSRTDYFRVDTLVGGGGQSLFVDSTSTEHIEMEYDQSQLLLDVGLIFGTNDKARWQLKGGPSLALGFTHTASTFISYERTSEYNIQVPGVTYPTTSYLEEEVFANSGSFVGMLSLPMILDFRIARKGNFFKRSHLYTEVRPFLYYTSIPEIDNQIQSGISWGFGFSYDI